MNDDEPKPEPTDPYKTARECPECGMSYAKPVEICELCGTNTVAVSE